MIPAQLTEAQRVDLLLHLDAVRDNYTTFQRYAPQSHAAWWQLKIDSATELYDLLNELRPKEFGTCRVAGTPHERTPTCREWKPVKP